MAQPMGTWWLTLSTAIVIDENVVMLAIDTSKSLAVGGIINPSVIMTRTDWDPASIDGNDNQRRPGDHEAVAFDPVGEDQRLRLRRARRQPAGHPRRLNEMRRGNARAATAARPRAKVRTP